MARRREAPRPCLGLVDGPCGCWAHDHPHPGGWPWHDDARRRWSDPRPDAERREARQDELIAAGCTTCSAVAGGTYNGPGDYLDRMGRAV